MSDPLPDEADENTLVIPDAWRAEIHPRRGGVPPVPGIVIDPSALDRLRELRRVVRSDRPGVDPVLFAGEDGEEEIVEAVRAYLGGAADPLGAAAIAQLQGWLSLPPEVSLPGALWVDAWAAEHGLAFAACAFAEVDQVLVSPTWTRQPKRFTLQHGTFRSGDEYFADRAEWAVQAPGRRMRALLAGAGESDYAEAVERLADRRRNPKQKWVVSYLVPTRQDWVDECLALPGRSVHALRLLWCAIGSADQIQYLDHRAPYEYYPPRDFDHLPGMLATMIEGVGPAIAGTLAKAVDPESEVKVRKAYLGALALLPTDEAFTLMAARLEQSDVRQGLVSMMERFPRRALRLLAPLASAGSKQGRSAALLLAEHLRANPELDATELPAQVRAAIEAVGGGRVVEATVDDLPKALASGRAQPPPGWASPAFMPQLLLRGRNRAVPADAAARLIEALSKTGPRRAPAAAARKALEACDPGSLAEFGWALFDRWRASGDVEDNGWPLSQLRWTGDAETARRLGAMVRSATFYDGYKLALNAMAVLAASGSDVALMQLHLSAEKAKPKGLKRRARKLLDGLAEERGLTPEQLADRLVPGFGLDADGSMTLDYGPRRFTVAFDEQLVPQVLDESGKLRKALPKPGVRDDPELAPAAHRAFAGLKKDVRTLAAEQIRRTERAMADQRRWQTGEFFELLVHHPLLWHITRRLIWWHRSDDAGHGKTTAFRLAEDRTLADVDDDVLTLPESGTVSVAHPVLLGADVAAWAGTFADYEILQPFPQLGRPVHALTAEERAAGRLDRFVGLSASPGKVLGLERQGWARGASEDGGMQPTLSRSLPGGHRVVIEISPGIPAWNPGETDIQQLRAVRIMGDGFFGDLDAVTASELLLVLHTMTEA